MMPDEDEMDVKEEGELYPMMENSFDPKLYSDERLEIYRMVSITVILLGLFLTIYMIARLFV